MLNTLKIGRRLGVAFGFILALLLAAVGTSLVQVRTMGDNLNRIVKVYSREQNLTATMQLQAQTIQVYLRTLLLSDDPAELTAAQSRLEEARSAYGAAANALKGLLISDRAKELFARVAVDRERALALNRKALALGAEGGGRRPWRSCWAKPGPATGDGSTRWAGWTDSWAISF